MTSPNSSFDPNVAADVESVTGSKVITHGFPVGSRLDCRAILAESSATNVNKAPVLTMVDNLDGTATIYAWKATAAGTTTLIAATAAVSVAWRVERVG